MKMLVNLRGVPEDERADILALLTDEGVDFYETGAGNWGIGQPGIWLRDPEQAELAGAVLEQYWTERRRRASEDRERRKRAGKLPGIADAFSRAPLRFLLAVAAIGLVLYLSIMPFLDLMGD